MRQARKLQVLCIDDAPPAFGDYTELDVTCVLSLRDVEELIRSNHLFFDVLICDVNMKMRNEYDHPKDMNLEWGEKAADPAYGPVLALPFLKGDLCNFVPRSNYWSHVLSNGYVLVSVAIIRSIVQRADVDIAEARKWIQERAANDLSTDLTLNVREGLDGLRRKIVDACIEGNISIAGIDSVCKRLRTWQPGTPFQEADGCPFHIQIIHPAKVDRIQVASLFTDMLEFKAPDAVEHANAIQAELKRWYEKDGGFQFPQYDDIYSNAVSLLVNYLPGSERTQSKKLKRLAQDKSRSTGIDAHCLMRIVVLFAFVRGWYFSCVNTSPAFRMAKKESRDRANRRTDDVATRYWDLMDWVYWFLGIDPDQATPQNEFKRLLGDYTSKVIVVGAGYHQRPFNGKYKNDVLQAYSCLREDEPAELLPIEQSLCFEFIRDQKSFYPEEMATRERIPWDLTDRPTMSPYPKWLTHPFRS